MCKFVFVSNFQVVRIRDVQFVYELSVCDNHFDTRQPIVLNVSVVTVVKTYVSYEPDVLPGTMEIKKFGDVHRGKM